MIHGGRDIDRSPKWLQHVVDKRTMKTVGDTVISYRNQAVLVFRQYLNYLKFKITYKT